MKLSLVERETILLYNQAVKALHTGLSEKKALAMLYKLEQLTIELISLNREIIRLTQEFEQWLQK